MMKTKFYLSILPILLVFGSVTFYCQKKANKNPDPIVEPVDPIIDPVDPIIDPPCLISDEQSALIKDANNQDVVFDFKEMTCTYNGKTVVMMDRNLGATKSAEKNEVTKDPEVAGWYYQFNSLLPAANMTEVFAVGKDNKEKWMNLKPGQKADLPSQLFDPAKDPCPKGYHTLDNNLGLPAFEIEELFDKLKMVGSGAYTDPDFDLKYDRIKGGFYQQDIHQVPADHPEYGSMGGGLLYINYNNSYVQYRVTYKVIGLPIRCVKN